MDTSPFARRKQSGLGRWRVPCRAYMASIMPSSASPGKSTLSPRPWQRLWWKLDGTHSRADDHTPSMLSGGREASRKGAVGRGDAGDALPSSSSSSSSSSAAEGVPKGAKAAPPPKLAPEGGGGAAKANGFGGVRAAGGGGAVNVKGPAGGGGEVEKLKPLGWAPGGEKVNPATLGAGEGAEEAIDIDDVAADCGVPKVNGEADAGAWGRDALPKVNGEVAAPELHVGGEAAKGLMPPGGGGGAKSNAATAGAAAAAGGATAPSPPPSARDA